MPAAPYADPTSPSSAAAYARRLLDGLGLAPPPVLRAPDLHPAIAWAASGLMSLTGKAGGPPMMCPVPLASCADGALAALAALAPAGALDDLHGAGLLAERAALLGLRRAGAVSPGGACRLYQVADGWIALNLPRADDAELLQAWLETPQAPSMETLASDIAQRQIDELVERGRLLGLAVAASKPPVAEAAAWFGIVARGPSAPVPVRRAPRVIDLSSLWAGPLCGQLLRRMGAEVIKLESPQRPDGARQGHPVFYDRLNAGKRSVAIDPRSDSGRRQWRALLRSADIIIEASRPRGLRQLGIDAEALLRERPGLTWLAISGHGRGEPQENWPGYGDDATVAAGLSHLMQQAGGEPVFVGDAIADPLTGLHAALAAWAGWQSGNSQLVSVSLSDVMRHCIGFDLPGSTEAFLGRQKEWTALAQQAGIHEPSLPATVSGAAALGADTAEMLAQLDMPC